MYLFKIFIKNFSFRNFIPGDFLDNNGNSKLVTPPPVIDVLSDVIERILDRSEDLWLIAGLLLSNVIIKLLNCILIAVSSYS